MIKKYINDTIEHTIHELNYYNIDYENNPNIIIFLQDYKINYNIIDDKYFFVIGLFYKNIYINYISDFSTIYTKKNKNEYKYIICIFIFSYNYLMSVILLDDYYSSYAIIEINKYFKSICKNDLDIINKYYNLYKAFESKNYYAAYELGIKMLDDKNYKLMKYYYLKYYIYFKSNNLTCPIYMLNEVLNDVKCSYYKTNYLYL